MKIIFALGNPSIKFSKSRHNSGFMAIEHYAKLYNISWAKSLKFESHIAELLTPNEKILLIKPDTFYNRSGESLAKLISYYDVDSSQDLLVLHDELMLDFGIIRFRASGRDAGNNGIKSIISHIGTKFHRIKIGIENEKRPLMDADQFVLGNFSKSEADILQSKIIPEISSLIDDFIAENKVAKSINLTQ